MKESFVIQWYPLVISEAERRGLMSEKEHCVFPITSHVEPKGGRHDGLAPMVCCTLWMPPHGHPRFFLLRASERSTLTMLAQGIDHAVTSIVSQLDRVPIVCVTESGGVWEHIKTVKGSYDRNRSEIDGLATFMALAELDRIVGIGKRKPENRLEISLVRRARTEATKQRIEVLADFRADPEVFKLPGVKWAGCELARAIRGHGPQEP